MWWFLALWSNYRAESIYTDNSLNSPLISIYSNFLTKWVQKLPFSGSLEGIDALRIRPYRTESLLYTRCCVGWSEPNPLRPEISVYDDFCEHQRFFTGIILSAFDAARSNYHFRKYRLKKVVSSQSPEILKITQIVIFHYFLHVATFLREMVKSTHFENDVTFDC